MEYAIGIVIIIVIIQFALHIMFYRSTSKEFKELRQKLPKESAARREERILKLYSNLEELMEAFEEYVDETRVEFERLRKETAYRSAPHSRVRERHSESKETVREDTEYRAQMRLPLPDMDTSAEGGVVLEINKPQRKKEAEKIPEDAEDKSQVLEPDAPEEAQTKEDAGKPEAQAEAAGAADDEEKLEKFIPPTAKNLSGVTVIRPFTPVEKSASKNVSEADLQASRRFATKPQKIRFLSSRGYHPDDIARELGIGKGEVDVVLRIDA